ncbi:MAG: peroxiredoxin family protein [Gemmatimonadales bacterium]
MVAKQFNRFLPLVGLAVAVALVTVLGAQNRSLKGQYADLMQRATQPHPGIFVPTFHTATLGGDSVTVGTAGAGGGQVLFFFTTTCPYCRESLLAWQQVASHLKAVGSASVYGIALDSLHLVREFVKEHDLGFPVVMFPEAKLAQLYRVRRVPLVMVLNEEGRVVYSRAGPLTGQAAIDSPLETEAVSALAARPISMR